jgi:hypothetical protein
MAIKVSGTTVIDDNRNIQNVGVITATSFVGNGSGLTGAGSTVVDDVSTNGTFYPLLTQQTSGTVTESKVSTTKLTFNPSTGALNTTTLTTNAGTFGSNGTGEKVIQSGGTASGGSNGDIYYIF